MRQKSLPGPPPIDLDGDAAAAAGDGGAYHQMPDGSELPMPSALRLYCDSGEIDRTLELESSDDGRGNH